MTKSLLRIFRRCAKPKIVHLKSKSILLRMRFMLKQGGIRSYAKSVLMCLGAART